MQALGWFNVFQINKILQNSLIGEFIYDCSLRHGAKKPPFLLNSGHPANPPLFFLKADIAERTR